MEGKRNQRGAKKKRGRRSRNARALVVPPTLLPPVQYVTMTYSFFAGVTEPGAGVGNFQTFRYCCTYDPDLTGAGGQPIGFATLAYLYTRFRTVKVRWLVEAINVGTGQVEVGVYPAVASVLPATVASWSSQPNCKAELVGLPAAGNSRFKAAISVSPWAVHGITKKQYMDEADYSNTNVSPALRNCHLHVWWRGFGAAASLLLRVRSIYYVQVSQPASLT